MPSRTPRALPAPGGPQRPGANGQHRQRSVLGPHHDRLHAHGRTVGLGPTGALDRDRRLSLTVIFQLVNLPVEFDASRRARLMLVDHGIVTEQEDRVVKRVLDAAARLYVAATLTAILTLLYFLIRAGLLGSSRDE